MTETSPASSLNCWRPEELPPNVRLGPESVITKEQMGDRAFKQFRTRCDPGLVIGSHCTMAGVHFNIGEAGRVTIGDFCYFQEAVLLCALDISIGNYVFIGWHATLADSDFHPVSPAERLRDVMANSPQSRRESIPRQPFVQKRIVIEDDVYIGPLAIILKGVRLGTGAFIEPGAVVARDVPPRTRVMGNPAVAIEGALV